MGIFTTLGKAVGTAVKTATATAKKNASSKKKSSSNPYDTVTTGGTTTVTNSGYKPLGTHNDQTAKDKDPNIYNLISEQGTLYNDAKARGDTTAMDYHHNQAETYRNALGYSGGDDGSDYIEKETVAKQMNPYAIGEENNNAQNYYDIQSEYEDRQAKTLEAQKEAQRLAVKQGVDRLNSQKRDVNLSYDDSARQAYVNNMIGKRDLPELMSAQGLTGGQTETANINLQTGYENNVNNINIARDKAINSIDTAINDLKNTGDIEIAKMIVESAQKNADAYLNLATQQVMYDMNKANADESEKKQEAIDNLAQYYGDYQARINYLEGHPDDPDYWTLPKLKILRQQKLQGMAEGENTINNQNVERAMAVLKTLGYATPEVASILGIPVGTTTIDYKNMAYDTSKPYYEPSSGGSSGDNGLTYKQVYDAVGGIMTSDRDKYYGMDSAFNKIEDKNLKNSDSTRILLNSNLNEREIISIMKSLDVNPEEFVLGMKRNGYSDDDVGTFVRTYTSDPEYQKGLIKYANS